MVKIVGSTKKSAVFIKTGLDILKLNSVSWKNIFAINIVNIHTPQFRGFHVFLMCKLFSLTINKSNISAGEVSEVLTGTM